MEGIGAEIRDDAGMSAKALPDFGAEAQPACGIEVEETADFAAPAHGAETPEVAVAVGALEQDLAHRAGTEKPVVDEGNGDVVIA